jgi:polyphenol oxidase
MRKSAFELSTSEVDRLKFAYTALRTLAHDHPDDPRGWLRQGYVHCWYCGGGTDGKAGEEIHGSWLFFPWHRAFLYFHERILCKLIGDDTLALPYWDWDSTGRQTFPDIYGNPNDPSNPLFDMLRSARANAAMSAQAVSTSVLNKAMNAPNNNLFMGSQGAGSGAMENAPHGPVHIWTGDTSMRSRGNDMGVLQTAAQDPIFFAHHGNSDRLWKVWLGLASNHQNFTSNTWLAHPWQFFDEDGNWTDITVNDVLDPVQSLRYDYAPPSKSPIWTFKPRNAPLIAFAKQQLDAFAPLVITDNATAPIPLGTAPVTREITIPAADARALSQLSTDTPAQFVLHIRGITVPADRQAMFNVFINLANATSATSTDSANFAGTVTVLAKTGEGRLQKSTATSAAFDVTDLLSDMKGSTQLSVTLVPVATEGVAPTESQATFQQISIEHI